MTREKREPYSKTVVLVTPQLAKDWIDELNKNNYRPPSWVKVQQLSDMLTAGKFFPRHPDGIRFDWFGRIGNGQLSRSESRAARATGHSLRGRPRWSSRRSFLARWPRSSRSCCLRSRSCSHKKPVA